MNNPKRVLSCCPTESACPPTPSGDENTRGLAPCAARCRPCILDIPPFFGRAGGAPAAPPCPPHTPRPCAWRGVARRLPQCLTPGDGLPPPPHTARMRRPAPGRGWRWVQLPGCPRGPRGHTHCQEPAPPLPTPLTLGLPVRLPAHVRPLCRRPVITAAMGRSSVSLLLSHARPSPERAESSASGHQFASAARARAPFRRTPTVCN